jgi:hypothetical protein
MEEAGISPRTIHVSGLPKSTADATAEQEGQQQQNQQQEQIETFVACSGTDKVTAQRFLEATGWNLEAAVNAFMMGGVPRVAAPPPPTPRTTVSSGSVIPFSQMTGEILERSLQSEGGHSQATQEGGVSVKLAVYDLSHGWARRLSPLLFCRRIELAPHTSILIFGKEYFWGGGIQKMEHEEFKQQSGTQPVEIIDLGTTEIAEDLFHDFILNVSSRYSTTTYDLLNNNCNNFSNQCSNFLLGQSIPAHILEAPEIVKKSCLGKCVLGICALSPVARTASVLLIQWLLAFIGLLVLSTMSKTDDCPAAPGDSTVNFAITLFVMEVVYSSWLGSALYLSFRGVRSPWLSPSRFFEFVVMALLALLGYSSAISISTLHVSLWRLYPEQCTHADPNYAKLSAGVAFNWMLFFFALISRLFIRVIDIIESLSPVTGAQGDRLPFMAPAQIGESGGETGDEAGGETREGQAEFV